MCELAHRSKTTARFRIEAALNHAPQPAAARRVQHAYGTYEQVLMIGTKRWLRTGGRQVQQRSNSIGVVGNRGRTAGQLPRRHVAERSIAERLSFDRRA